MHGWRVLILRLFGATIGARAHVYPSTIIWAPWNLVMERGACLGPGVICYNVANVTLGEQALVSQRAHLCTASHDFNSPVFALVTAPIGVGAGAWICAEAFVGPGVTIEYGAIVGARGVATRTVEALNIVAGNPARVVGRRASE
jgi:putative colanic acid biosynthesis acetyltransferase WcaF